MAACQSTGGLGARTDDPLAPPGVDPREAGVDPLIVGHRLMDAGEFELALRSYNLAAAERGATVEVLASIGSANLRLGRLGQAESILRRAIEEDETFPPAWNNLGVILMETGRYGEASRVFQNAFALDSGRSAEIRENLRLALAKLDDPSYSVDDKNFALVWTGGGTYALAPLPEAEIEQ